MAKIIHHAFSFQYPGRAERLPSEAVVEGPGGKSMKARAVWDTGAMRTVITPQAAAALDLAPIETVTVTGVNNISSAPVTIISVILPNSVRVYDLKAVICDMRQGIDLLIGMDIITMGDFVICNGGGKTLFSFAIPSFPNTIDLLETANELNSRDNQG
jgi:predicted aspartyl protease